MVDMRQDTLLTHTVRLYRQQKTPMLVLDMATSRVAQGKVRVAHYAEKQTPMPDALVGPNGKLTTDPGVMFRDPKGALSFGEHKGYGHFGGWFGRWRNS